MKIAFIAVLIIGVIGLGFIALTRKPNSNSMPINSESVQTSNMEPASGRRYIQYSQEDYGGIVNQKHVLFFYANWCPTCRPADAEFQAKTNEIPEDLVLVRVNYNDPDTDASEKALSEQYGITYQHTFVLIENGQEVTKWNGGGLNNLLLHAN